MSKLIPSDYYVVIDFEATCDRKNFPPHFREIIEFAGVIVDKEFKPVAEFTRFVKPKIRPRLTRYCTELTTIKQSDVDDADPFPIVLEDFREFIDGYKPIFCSWGRYDYNQLWQDCEFHSVDYPFTRHHVNIKNVTADKLNIRRRGVSAMLKHLKMDFEGTPHRGIDDVRNIIRIAQKVLV